MGFLTVLFLMGTVIVIGSGVKQAVEEILYNKEVKEGNGTGHHFDFQGKECYNGERVYPSKIGDREVLRSVRTNDVVKVLPCPAEDMKYVEAKRRVDEHAEDVLMLNIVYFETSLNKVCCSQVSAKTREEAQEKINETFGWDFLRHHIFFIRAETNPYVFVGTHSHYSVWAEELKSPELKEEERQLKEQKYMSVDKIGKFIRDLGYNFPYSPDERSFNPAYKYFYIALYSYTDYRPDEAITSYRYNLPIKIYTETKEEAVEQFVSLCKSNKYEFTRLMKFDTEMEADWEYLNVEEYARGVVNHHQTEAMRYITERERSELFVGGIELFKKQLEELGFPYIPYDRYPELSDTLSAE